MSDSAGPTRSEGAEIPLAAREYLRWLDHPRLQNIAHLATTASAIVGAILLAFAAYQLKLSAEQHHDQSALQREIAANGSWERYMELASSKPLLAAGQDYASLPPLKKVEYFWFVERMLFAGEQVLNIDPDDAEWQSVIQVEARRHSTYFGSRDFIFESMCGYMHKLRRTLAEAFETSDVQLAARLRHRDTQCSAAGYDD